MTQTTILIAEDQGIIAQDIRQILTGWGYAVPAIATSGKMAIQKATELCPDLILMDIVLKGEMDGIQAADQIRESLDIPVIFLTAYADDETLQRAKITEPYGYLLKPFKEQELRTSIDIALYKYRMEKRLKESQEHWRALIEIANVLNSSLDRQKVLQHILDQLARVIDYDSASVMLLSQEMLNIVAHQGFREESQVFTPLQIETLPHIQQVLKSRRPLIIDDVHVDPRWQHRDDSTYIRCWLGVPMIVQERVIGLLNLDKEQPNYYTPRDAELAVAFANQAAIAIENTRLYEQAQQDAETKAMLLREVNHRVKNNLTAIIGLLYAERRHAGMEDQPTYQAILQDLISRVQGLSTVHGMLSASEWAPPLLNELAERVIRSALQTLPRDKQVRIDAPPSPVRVTPAQAHHLAMVINELATNTAKHTLHERDVARITVHITREDDMVLLTFRDDGPGYPPQVLTLAQHNVGFDLVQSIVRKSLRGELTLRNVKGAVTLVRFPSQVKGNTT